MSWRTILKVDYPPMEQMIRELWDNWFYNELESFEEYTFEQGSLYDDSDYHSEFSRTFTKIREDLAGLDPIRDSGKIKLLLGKLADHPSLPMEVISYPIIGSLSESRDVSELDEDEVRAKYDEYR